MQSLESILTGTALPRHVSEPRLNPLLDAEENDSRNNDRDKQSHRNPRSKESFSNQTKLRSEIDDHQLKDEQIDADTQGNK